MHYRYTPIETAVADRFRDTGHDEASEPVRRMTSSGAYPCRHCLDLVEDGRDALLGSYKLVRPLGAYWTPSPIFVHADACERYADRDVLPAFMRHALLSMRAYDGDDQMIYPVSDVAPGAEVDALIERAFDDPNTRYANIHTARYGCYLCRVEPA